MKTIRRSSWHYSAFLRSYTFGAWGRYEGRPPENVSRLTYWLRVLFVPLKVAGCALFLFAAVLIGFPALVWEELVPELVKAIFCALIVLTASVMFAIALYRLWPPFGKIIGCTVGAVFVSIVIHELVGDRITRLWRTLERKSGTVEFINGHDAT